MTEPERIVYTNYRSCIGYKTHDGYALVPVDNLDDLMVEIGYLRQDDVSEEEWSQ